MTSARRRVNSTGRKRIGQKCVDIRMLVSEPGAALKASISVSLDGLGFPHDALVAVEAYYRSSGMRFELGSVRNLRAQEILELSEIDRAGAALFRLKVIDNNVEPGKVLGSAERIAPRCETEGKNRRFLFPVQYQDLDADVWRVSIEDEDRPRLIINSRLRDFRHKLQQEPLIFGIILPAALRFVLQGLVSNSESGEDEYEQGWKEDWLEYCREALHVQDDPRNMTTEIDKKDWIDKAVMRFCENFEFVQKMNNSAENVR